MHSERNYEITWLIRRIFRQMGRTAGESLEEFGITAADRAVMEFLYPDEALSVPEIAERYDVSRQHVQVTVNALMQEKLLNKNPNPKHKRSDLICLSPAGRKLFRRIRKQDAVIVGNLFADIPERQLSTTLKTLQTLNKRLHEGLEQ
jgi:DNA-binding MarR family transcriptional regulator